MGSSRSSITASEMEGGKAHRNLEAKKKKIYEALKAPEVTRFKRSNPFLKL